MKVLTLYFKCVLVLALSGLAVSVPVSKDVTALKVDSACKEIKCPSVSKPVCIELKFQQSALHTKTVYMEVSNRCEMKYISCYQGDAKVKELPMSYCDHGKNVTSDMHTLQVLPASKFKSTRSKLMKEVKNMKPVHKKSLKTSKKIAKSKTKVDRTEVGDVKKRVKREAQSKKQELAYLKAAKKALFDDTAVKKFESKRVPKKFKLRNSYNPMRNKPKSNILRVENDEVEETTQDTGTTYLIYAKGPPGNTSKEENASDDEGQLLILPTDKNTAAETLKQDGDDEKGDDEDPRELLVKEEEALAAVDTDREEYQIRSQEAAVTEKVNEEDRTSECPKSCPSRGVMLCGRCKDHIYRTFLSECHMRMFDCHHPDEKLELVSRLPCAMSGPYLEDLRVPEGVVHEPDDDDIVLRFIRCKDYSSSKLQPWSTINCDFAK